MSLETTRRPSGEQVVGRADRSPIAVFNRLAATTFPNYESLADDALRKLGFQLTYQEMQIQPGDHNNGSAAVYIGDQTVAYEPWQQADDEFVGIASGNHRLLFAMQEGPAFPGDLTRTSLHYHTPPMREIYYPLGKGKLYVNLLQLEDGEIVRRSRILVPREGLAVESGVPHFADTEGGDPSFALIVMEQAGDVSLDQQHIPLVAKLPGDSTSRVISAREINWRVPLAAE